MKGILNNATLINACRWWLVGLLFIMPFHFTIYKMIHAMNKQLANIYNRLDEISIVILIIPAIAKLYVSKDKSYQPCLLLLLSIVIVMVAGFISGMSNQNPFFMTFLGTFDYIKHFLVIFIYASFFRNLDEFRKIFRVLIVVAVFIALVALVEESWFLFAKYILGKEVFSGRLGIYRASSLVSHYNLLGLYCLFILAVYTTMKNRINYAVVVSLLVGVVASVSRTAYTGFVILAGYHIYAGRKLFMILLVPAIIGLVFMSSLGDFDVLEIVRSDNSEEYSTGNGTDVVYFREYARQKAMNVWRDYPMLGAGPGMFGGPTALKYRSPLYEEYNFHVIYSQIHSLDQLWPQVLAEMGILGAVTLAGLFVSLIMIFIMSRQLAQSEDLRGLFAGLLIFTIALLVYTMSSNLNIISVLFPYCAFAGIGLGCLGERMTPGVH